MYHGYLCTFGVQRDIRNPGDLRLLYHWGGKNLITDTIVHGKRSNWNRTAREISYEFDMRRWIFPPEDELLGKQWARLG